MVPVIELHFLEVFLCNTEYMQAKMAQSVESLVTVSCCGMIPGNGFFSLPACLHSLCGPLILLSAEHVALFLQGDDGSI
jgi:hypothetical protein